MTTRLTQFWRVWGRARAIARHTTRPEDYHLFFVDVETNMLNLCCHIIVVVVESLMCFSLLFFSITIAWANLETLFMIMFCLSSQHY